MSLLPINATSILIKYNDKLINLDTIQEIEPQIRQTPNTMQEVDVYMLRGFKDIFTIYDGSRAYKIITEYILKNFPHNYNGESHRVSDTATSVLIDNNKILINLNTIQEITLKEKLDHKNRIIRYYSLRGFNRIYEEYYGTHSYRIIKEFISRNYIEDTEESS